MNKIRKQVYKLTLQDIDNYPIWKFALDEEGIKGQDEATVKPCIDIHIADPNKDIFFVKTEFIANDGSKFFGCCTPSNENNLSTIHPIIITSNGQVNFWYGRMKPKSDMIKDNYTKLEKDADSLFPLKYKALVQHKGVNLNGIIYGFMYLENITTNKIREIK
jgi:hypothetical protein